MAQEKDERGSKRDGAAGKDSDGEFIPPDFDEDAFIHREMVSFRTTAILFAWGIVAALASWLAFKGLDGADVGWLIGLGIAAAFGVALKWLFPRLGADIQHFGRREWLGTGALFFFTWLSFFLIAINPPLSDFAPPRVDFHAAPVAQQAGGNVTIHLFVEDNVKVTDHTFRLTQGGQPIAMEGDLRSLGRGHYVYTASGLAPGVYHLEGTAEDSSGLTGDGELDFAVSETVLDYSATSNGVLSGAADRIVVTTGDVPACKAKKGQVTTRDPCVRTVRLEMRGEGRQVVLPYDRDAIREDVGAWVGTTALAGWVQGNNTFDVVAEMADQYDGSVRFDGGEIVLGPRTVQVTGTPGSEVVEPALDPNPPHRSVPGPAPLLLAGAVLAAAAVLRRRR